MLQLHKDWKERLTGRAFVDKPVFTNSGIVCGFGSILLRSRCDRPDITFQDDDERLVCLLSVAGFGPPRSDLSLLFKTALADWDRGEKAIAAIRLAFAPVPRIVTLEDAYRLYLAEQALDAGLKPEILLKEFGLDAGVLLAKYNRNQPRVPAGNGRDSGEFGSQSFRAGDKPDARAAVQDKPTISVFYDERKAETLEEEGPIDILPFGGHLRHGHALPAPDDIGVPLFLPFLVPFLDQDKKDEGPDCPAMLPDRLHGENAAGEREEGPGRGSGQPGQSDAEEDAGNAGGHVHGLLFGPSDRRHGCDRRLQAFRRSVPHPRHQEGRHGRGEDGRCGQAGHSPAEYDR